MAKSIQSPGTIVGRMLEFQLSYRSKLAEAILTGRFPEKKLGVLAKQVYLQEKWPSHIAHVYLSMDESALGDRELVKYVISIIKAENLGVGSLGIPHSELASRFARSVGVSDNQLKTAIPTVQNRALMDWCDMSALERPWIESFAVHIACESQMRLMAKIAKGLLLNYRATAEDVLFWTVHAGPLESKHARDGLNLLAKHTSKKDEKNVLYSYEMSCKLLSQFYNSILGE